MRVLLLILLLVGLALWFLNNIQRLHWVGYTDLTVEFVVTDAETGQPIEGADLSIHSEGGFYEDRTTHDFVLKTDKEGIARHVCRNSMCFGTSSRWFSPDTFVVHLPWWFIGTTAPGFQKAEPFFLDETQYIRAVRRAGPGQARLTVPISLHKSP